MNGSVTSAGARKATKKHAQGHTQQRSENDRGGFFPQCATSCDCHRGCALNQITHPDTPTTFAPHRQPFYPREAIKQGLTSTSPKHRTRPNTTQRTGPPQPRAARGKLSPNLPNRMVHSVAKTRVGCRSANTYGTVAGPTTPFHPAVLHR
jgi:hypothetical protein